MNYRKLGRVGWKVSEIGLGGEHLQGQPYEVVEAVVLEALDQGINIMDIFMSEPEVRSNIGRALKGRRDQMILQGHIGAGWIDGQYCRTRDRKQCQTFFEDFMTRLGTDYVDIGMLHFVDTEPDFQQVLQSGMLDYARELKKKGVIRAIGMSSHDPSVALKAVKTGELDVLMFSVNPAYDLLPEDADIDSLFRPETFRNDGLNGTNPTRAQLYRTCESMGTAVTVMKGLGAGSLLRAESSPFGVALTPSQCIHYSLTRPAVCSVLVGCRTPEEVQRAVEYEQATEQERDYSVILSSTPKYSMRGKCMYCNHCLPCPAQINIAQVNKFLDLANQAPEIPDTVREHYAALEHHAEDCIECGSCEANCPFEVPVIERMRMARKIFG